MNNQKEYNKSLDERTRYAKNRILEHLTPKWNVEMIEEGKSIKLFCKDKKTNNILFKVEIEVRFSWRTESFPYETVTIPLRKKKFMEEDIKIFYVVLNEFGNNLLITEKGNILCSKVIKKDTMYTKDEEFYDVLLEKFSPGYKNMVDYIEYNIRYGENKEDQHEEPEESKRTTENMYIMCPNCEVISSLEYKEGLCCPVCEFKLFNDITKC